LRALLTDGTVKCWGSNYRGILDGTTTQRTTPVDVSGITNATSIALGGYHSCTLLTDGKWEKNDYGQFGDGSTTGSTTIVDLSGLILAFP